MIGILRYLIFSSYFFISPIYAADDTELQFVQAEAAYESGDYKSAMSILEEIVNLSPKESKYHHLLGKTYGRIAETGSWMSAMSYAKKCLKSFQLAVELDNENIRALNDLKSYYEEAPGFLGGSKKRAKEIESRLKALQSVNPA